jgi:hypothetical protein
MGQCKIIFIATFTLIMLLILIEPYLINTLKSIFMLNMAIQCSPSCQLHFINSMPLNLPNMYLIYIQLHPSNCNSSDPMFSIRQIYVSIHPMHSIHRPTALHQFNALHLPKMCPHTSNALHSPFYGIWWILRKRESKMLCEH